MRVAIVSPSGKFYGSEQTLLSFLTYSESAYDVYVAQNDGSLLKHLNKLGKHNVYLFRKPYLLYVKLFGYLIVRRYTGLYVNEGGHIKYLKLLAFIFPYCKFITHIRINEDTTKERLDTLPKNIELISVSSYIRKQIMASIGVETEVLSSPYRNYQSNKKWRNDFLSHGEIKIGIIGRVTNSKGLNSIISFYRFMLDRNIDFISLHFFGHIEVDKHAVKEFFDETNQREKPKCEFHGFVKNKDDIFDEIDVVAHFNQHEPLGVIFFEALKNGVPFVGFNSGGIGDIASQLQINELMIDLNENWAQDLVHKVESVHDYIHEYDKARILIDKMFSIQNYCARLESKFK